MKTPLCSIVMPAFNVEPYIREAIQSVFAQSLSDWELIVIDDGSSDGTVAAVREFTDRRIRLLQQANAGVGAARNHGIARSRGRMICFLDADDRLRPQAINSLSRTLKRAPQACVAYGESVVMDATGQSFGTARGPIFAQRPSGQVLWDILQSNFVTTVGAACICASALTRVGNFRTDMVLGEDWDLWCRLATVGEFIYVGKEPIVEYRLRPDSAMRTLGTDMEESLRSVDAVFSRLEIRRHFTENELGYLRRKREAAVYATAGTEHLKIRRWVQARKLFFESLRRDLTRPREVILLALSFLWWMPPIVARHLK